MELKDLKGVGPKTIEKLNQAGIFQPLDLLHWFPRDYLVFEEARAICDLVEEETACIFGHFQNPPVSRAFQGKRVTSGTFLDATGKVSVKWFNMPYIVNGLPKGDFYLRGRFIKKGRTWNLYQPSILTQEQYEGMLNHMIPVYPLRAGLTNKQISALIQQCLEQTDLFPEYLPASVRQSYHLPEANFAIRNIHEPLDEHALLLARQRLVFDEFFFFMLSVRALKEQKEELPNGFPCLSDQVWKSVLQGLPYELTTAQKRTLYEVAGDMKGPHVMSRLIQGDVGSGKTVVAVLAMLMACENGYQSALMAPTEVLASQHYEGICSLLKESGLPYKAVLLTGSSTASQKRKIYEQIERHEADLIVGTHALIQEKLAYDQLGLVITDEQHRFGVKQRAALSEKSLVPHVLVMSATPIPRTLALILYGDLDISVIDELPANRIPIKNCVVDPGYLKNAYRFIEKEVEKGRQAYVVCSMVEESEQIQAENVTEYVEKLRAALPGHIRIACLHGKMKAKEKAQIMNAFANHETDVLVSTTVIEVGVNVPNATIMMIENAERFGLSQLHQLRGRVGRGEHQSYCIFMDRSGRDEKSRRLSVLEKSNDGFFIAAEDLKLRGPGDFYGTRQNGQLQFALADIFTDAGIMKEAREAADAYYDHKLTITAKEQQHIEALLLQHRRRQDAAQIPL